MLKVLVVEDEEMIRKGIVLAVDWAALDCVVAGEAANGEEGLLAAEKYQPSLIITDLKMPRMDGLEMVRRLRERGCEAYVIILTAYDSFEYARSALRLGAVDFLLKPFHDGDLEGAVTALRRRMRAQDGESEAVPGLKRGDKSRYVLAAMDYIGAHYAEAGVTVGSIAQALGISEGHLSHTFKKETDYTLLGYLSRYRIHKAMELLREGRWKVYEVAGQVGYRDITYFSAMFKKHTGMTPSEYQDTAWRREGEDAKGLIVSDVDGTLLLEDGQALPEDLFPQLRRLMGEGWIFCPASGRQYQSLRRLFAPMEEELTYLCENGAVLFGPGGRLLGKTVMPRREAEALCREILNIEGCEVLISGENMSYVIPKTVDMAALMEGVKRNNVTVVPAPEAVPEDITKVSAYCPAGTGAIPPGLAAAWPQYHPAVAGGCWLDFTRADKGTGLSALCEALRVPLENVVAFGDNYNDAPMLALAGQPWLMETADPSLLERFPRHCSSVPAVLAIL